MKRICVTCCLLLFPSLAWADGGTLRLSQRIGDYQISAFASPAVLRVGSIDLSVLVQDAATGQVRTDVPVTVSLRCSANTNFALEQLATTTAATNKIFRAAFFDIPEPGAWQASISIGDSAVLSSLNFDLLIAPPPPAWLQLAPWVGWPLVAIALFGVHQRLVVRRESPRGSNPCYVSDSVVSYDS